MMAINLMKRMESSVYSFNLTLERIKGLIDSTIDTINRFNHHTGTTLNLTDISNVNEFDGDDQDTDDLFAFGKKVKIDLADMDYESWRKELQKDAEVLELLTYMVRDITPEHDLKLRELFRVINNKITAPINPGNEKIIIFTAFSDTAEYLYNNVGPFVKEKFGLNTAMITGNVEGRTTCPRLRSDLNTVLTCFSPISKGKELLMPGDNTKIDILIATDCISEGQNLQDCDYLVNYDIHWNPVRIIQRFGRIDRIGSRNKVIQLVNFWPDVTLDDYINLKARVETRMKIVDMTATGDDNLLSNDEKTDLEYRKAQLKRLQDEVVDIEDMTTGISIMDLGLNEFRLDLLEYVKNHPDIEKTPFGLHSVVPAGEDAPAGVIFVLKNRSNSVNIDNQNRLHPFYMVYIGDDGEVVCNHLSPKQMLDRMRFLCKGQTEPIPAAYKPFNKETRDGKNKIGVALARKVWGKRFQVLVATHMNTDNLHNHFVINSVSYVDGKKYEQRRSQYAEFRAASDKLCREYGLSVVEQPKAKEPARYARMREAIDQACEDASTAEDFHRALYRQGYIFGSDPNRRYATIRARDGGRAVRLYRLGEEYDLAAIDDRLRGNYLLYGPRLYEVKHPPRQYTPKRYRPKDSYAGKGILQIFFEVFFGESQMHRLYLYYCYQLGILPKKQQPRINRPELERIWKDTEKILAEHAFVHDHKFPSLQAIVDYRKSLSQQMETLAAQRAEVVKQMRRKDASPELADQRMALTCKIAELRKEDKIAEGAIKRIQRTSESNRIDRENRMQLHPRQRRRRREQERE